jgi:hypothetical protein
MSAKRQPAKKSPGVMKRGVEPRLYICDIGNHVVTSNPCPQHKKPTKPY